MTQKDTPQRRDKRKRGGLNTHGYYWKDIKKKRWTRRREVRLWMETDERMKKEDILRVTKTEGKKKEKILTIHVDIMW